jgi:hypothetical protein
MALTALFFENAWNMTLRAAGRPGSGGSTNPDTLPSACPAGTTCLLHAFGIHLQVV